MEPRGIRNNNPGNIRLGDPWQGLAKDQNDSSFCVFISPEYGIRAIAKILLTYKRDGYDTITEIISHWAPPEENNTKAYIDAVSNTSGIDANVLVDIEDFNTALNIIKGIILHENGEQPYDFSTLEKGLELADIFPSNKN